jgi:hypothetical protein
VVGLYVQADTLFSRCQVARRRSEKGHGPLRPPPHVSSSNRISSKDNPILAPPLSPKWQTVLFCPFYGVTPTLHLVTRMLGLGLVVAYPLDRFGYAQLRLWFAWQTIGAGTNSRRQTLEVV